MTISDDSNSSLNMLLTMFVAGSLATIGISISAIHIVIGAMLMAPGFMPLIRIALDLVCGRRVWWFGIEDWAKGYFALIAGAALTTLVLDALGYNSLNPTSTYYPAKQSFITYWTTFTLPSVAASIVAALAGVLLVASKKSVFTSGVMVGLALVPSATIIGITFLSFDWGLLIKALLRFTADSVIVVAVAWLTLLVDMRCVHKRGIRL